MSRRDLLGRMLVALLLIGSVYFGLAYLKERQQQNVLVARLSDANKMLALITNPPSDLPQKLAAAQQANSAAKAIWPPQIDTTQVIKSILSAADAASIKAIPLSTDQWTTKTINNSNYRVLAIKISFEGTLANLTTLLTNLYGSQFTTLAVETVTVTKVTGSAPGVLSGSIDLAVYTQPAN